jgi:hypothetical protein
MNERHQHSVRSNRSRSKRRNVTDEAQGHNHGQQDHMPTKANNAAVLRLMVEIIRPRFWDGAGSAAAVVGFIAMIAADMATVNMVSRQLRDGAFLDGGIPY